MMSRKHFVELAQIVKGLKGKADEYTRRTVAAQLASLCARNSEQFDSARFYAACELEDEKPTRHVNDPSRWRR